MNKHTWIPGYQDSYSIDQHGNVYNSSGHKLKAFQTGKGMSVELRKDGQRECYSVEYLMEMTYNDTENFVQVDSQSSRLTRP